MKILFEKSSYSISKLESSTTEQETEEKKVSFLNLQKESKKNLQVSYAIEKNTPIAAGMRFIIRHSGFYRCPSCQKTIKKLFDGFCYPCFQRKAAADRCVMNPHLCHYMSNSCREPQWGEEHCYKPHYVYLSYTDKFKVGITRCDQIPTRWIDQGATSAALLAKVTSRHQAGIIEHALKEILADKSHWLKMLKMGNNRPSSEEFYEKYFEVYNWLSANSAFTQGGLCVQTPPHLNLAKEIEFFLSPGLLEINYPLPDKETQFQSVSLEKTPEINSIITGIKGQYIFFADKVFNMRRHSGFLVDLQILSDDVS